MDQEEANRLSQMPSMVVQVEPKQYTYILPPIVYPDGYIYIKFGQHDLSKKLETQSQVKQNNSRKRQDQWFSPNQSEYSIIQGWQLIGRPKKVSIGDHFWGEKETIWRLF